MPVTQLLYTEMLDPDNYARVMQDRSLRPPEAPEGWHVVELAPGHTSVHCERCAFLLGSFVQRDGSLPFQSRFVCASYCLCTLPADRLRDLLLDRATPATRLRLQCRILKALMAAGCELREAESIASALFPFSELVKNWVRRALARHEG
jgi:hypothetical protein